MAISQEQESIIVKAHAAGHLDLQIAQLAGVSLTTVKRYRRKFGLETNCVTNRRGKLGEQLVYDEATRRGLNVEWRDRHNGAFDLYVQGQRVDAKASMQMVGGAWRFRLSDRRPSFYGQYMYRKDYAADCDVVALVALYPDGREPDFYLLDSRTLPRDVRIQPGNRYDTLRNKWDVLEPKQPGAAA
ncbi:hypothetical protein ACFSR9_13085 [Deinococcus taklimakanensis]|uniref:Uncharacterized protein n=1 Tax=Deinococcus taklimakanensis TaxID=536443 RepID=A0ABW5P8C1_9DEIO